MSGVANSVNVIVGSDDAGVGYRKIIAATLRNSTQGVGGVREIGPEEGECLDYPEVGVEVAEAVSRGDAEKGILICGTGLGMAIAANKVKGIRAGVAHDSYSVERLALSNDAQILCLGQRVIGIELAKRLALEWVGYMFDSNNKKSARKINKIIAYESNRGG